MYVTICIFFYNKHFELARCDTIDDNKSAWDGENATNGINRMQMLNNKILKICLFYTSVVEYLGFSEIPKSSRDMINKSCSHSE